ncbi:MAG: hypothetical protein RMK29_12875 [Myxococcales bacterium]|nr:hypothetical protein [Myxococcota bacterium]MDW8282598.1 hypothetical protein [Myxococcales bacterium]
MRGVLVLLYLGGCSPAPGEEGAGQALHMCLPGNGGGDLGCACTDNPQCFGFDEDTRLIICDVPAGAMVGACLDCLSVAQRPVGCACSSDMDCAMGLRCNGRTCQSLRARGEFCLFDADCGSDMMGPLRCLPTKSYCGPGPDGYFCDFDDDCLSNNCNDAGICSSGAVGDDCFADADCKGGTVCSFVTYKCINPQPDGAPCTRNRECQNQCNSFSGVCLLGTEGQRCTTMNSEGPDADCMMGLVCVDCGGPRTCRPAGGPCS